MEFLELRNEALQVGLSKGTKGIVRFPSPILFDSVLVKEVDCLSGDIVCGDRVIPGGTVDSSLTRKIYERILETLKP
jgi:hypothetical protein